MKCRKKPIVIEAVQMTPEMRRNFGPFPEWAIPYLTASRTSKIDNSECVSIKTLEGELFVSDYDFIMRGVNDECYPCKPDIFYKTYDVVTETLGDLPTSEQKLEKAIETCVNYKSAIDKSKKDKNMDEFNHVHMNAVVTFADIMLNILR